MGNTTKPVSEPQTPSPATEPGGWARFDPNDRADRYAAWLATGVLPAPNYHLKAGKDCLAERLARAIGESGIVAELGRNTEQGFNYARVDDVVQLARGFLAKHGIVMLSSVVAERTYAVTFRSGGHGTGLVTLAEVRALAASDPEDHLVFYLTASCEAAGDKHRQINLSTIRKYALVELLLLPRGPGDDAEAHPEREVATREAAEDGDPVIPFGKLKGQRVSQVPFAELRWFAEECKMEDLQAAAKARIAAEQTHDGDATKRRAEYQQALVESAWDPGDAKEVIISFIWDCWGKKGIGELSPDQWTATRAWISQGGTWADYQLSESFAALDESTRRDAAEHLDAENTATDAPTTEGGEP